MAGQGSVQTAAWPAVGSAVPGTGEVTIARPALGETWHGTITSATADGMARVRVHSYTPKGGGRKRKMRHHVTVPTADLIPAPRRVQVRQLGERKAFDEVRHPRGHHGTFADADDDRPGGFSQFRGWVKKGAGRGGLDEAARKANADRAKTGVLKRAQRQQMNVGAGLAVAGGSSDIERPIAEALTRAAQTGKDHYVIPTAIGMAASSSKISTGGYIRVRPDGEVTDWRRPEGGWAPHEQVATLSDHTVSDILDTHLSKTRTAAPAIPKPAKKNPDARWSRAAIARAIKDVDKTPELQQPDFYQRIRDVAAASDASDLIPAGWGRKGYGLDDNAGGQQMVTAMRRRMRDGTVVLVQVKGLFDAAKHPRDRHGHWINVGHVVHLADGSAGKITAVRPGGKVEVETHDGRRVEVAANTVSVHAADVAKPAAGFRGFKPGRIPLVAATPGHPPSTYVAKPAPGDTLIHPEHGRVVVQAVHRGGRIVEAHDGEGTVTLRRPPSGVWTRTQGMTLGIWPRVQQRPDTDAAKPAARQRAAAPLTDAEYHAHTQAIEGRLKGALEAGLATDHVHTMDPARTVWTPERAAVHKEIVDKMLADAKDVPNEGKGVIAGGLGGAGKSTVLAKHAGIDTSRYMTINPDDIKEEMARRGLIPKVDGLSPMESAALVHEESSRIGNLAAQRAYGQHKNVVWDITMSSAKSADKRIADMRGAGYGDVRGVFVDIPGETSVQRAMARHRHGLEDYRAGKGFGGRYVPPEIIRQSAGTGPVSTNRAAFEQLRPRFDSWSLYDNSVHGRAPVHIASGGTPAAAAPWTVDGNTAHFGGSLGIDRGDMPQLSGTVGGTYVPSAVTIPEFTRKMQDQGVPVTRETVPASSLKPVQTTGDIRDIQGIAASLRAGKTVKPVIASSDDRVIDGHHTWAGGVVAGQDVPALRVGLPAAQLLGEVRAFSAARGIASRKTGVTGNPEYAKPVPAPPAEDVRRLLSEIPDMLGTGGQLHSTADRRLAVMIGDMQDELGSGLDAADWDYIRGKMPDLAAAERDAAKRGEQGSPSARGLAAKLGTLRGALAAHLAARPAAGKPTVRIRKIGAAA